MWQIMYHFPESSLWFGDGFVGTIDLLSFAVDVWGIAEAFLGEGVCTLGSVLRELRMDLVPPHFFKFLREVPSRTLSGSKSSLGGKRGT